MYSGLNEKKNEASEHTGDLWWNIANEIHKTHKKVFITFCLLPISTTEMSFDGSFCSPTGKTIYFGFTIVNWALCLRRMRKLSAMKYER